MRPARASRLADIPGFGIDRVAAAAGTDPDVLRLENLDTDLPPPPGVVEATRDAVGRDEFNSYLPFTGREDVKTAVAMLIERRSGVRVDPGNVTITGGEGDSMLNALLATVDVGDEVILTDPVYAGMINRVRLVGGVPRTVPLVVSNGSWRLDLERLSTAVTPRTRAAFIMSPAFPTGSRLNDDEWDAIARVCLDHDLWLLYWQFMEGIVFDDERVIHPAAMPGMAERTVTIGSVSAEWRMIGWRIGWTAAPQPLASDLGLVHIYNNIVAGGIAQAGALVALQAPEEDLRQAVVEWQRRRDVVVRQLDGLPFVRADGGWSLLLDCHAMGITPAEASQRLLANKVAATPMTGWGAEVADRHIRLVFSNEPVERLELLGTRAGKALT